MEMLALHSVLFDIYSHKLSQSLHCLDTVDFGPSIGSLAVLAILCLLEVF